MPTPLDERSHKDVKANDMPLVGAVFGDLQARLLMLDMADKHRRAAVLWAEEALSRKPNDAAGAWRVARVAEGRRPRRGRCDVSAGAAAGRRRPRGCPAEALPAAVRREAELSLARHGESGR